MSPYGVYTRVLHSASQLVGSKGDIEGPAHSSRILPIPTCACLCRKSRRVHSVPTSAGVLVGPEWRMLLPPTVIIECQHYLHRRYKQLTAASTWKNMVG